MSKQPTPESVHDNVADAFAESVQRQRPGGGQGGRVVQPGKERESRLPVDYFFYFDALEELVFASGYRDDPCFALLDGRFGLDSDGPFIELTGFSKLQYTGDTRGIHHPLRDAMEEKFAEAPEKAASDPYPVAGLFLGEPHSQAVLSKPVARAQLSLFNVPYQVVVVCDPVSELIGAYARNDHGRFVNETFRVVYESTLSNQSQPKDET